MRNIPPTKHGTATSRPKAALLLVLALLAGTGCEASQQRFATETAEAIAQSPAATETHTPSGDLLMIDDAPVRLIYVPQVEGPARYAMTDERLYVRGSGEWLPTETRADDRHLLVDPQQPERLFRGDHPLCFEDTDSQEAVILSKSVDSGRTWRAIPDGENVRPLLVDPTIADVIYGSNCGLMISTDAGETWRQYYRADHYAVVDVVAVNDRLLVLQESLAGRGQLREIDITVPDTPEIGGILLEAGKVFDVDADDNRIVVGGISGVFISEDGGRNWALSRTGLEEVTLDEEGAELPPGTETPDPDFGVLVVKIDPTQDQRMFAGTVRGLYISEDNGSTWSPYRLVDPAVRVTGVDLAAGGEDLYLTTPRGVVVVPSP